MLTSVNRDGAVNLYLDIRYWRTNIIQFHYLEITDITLNYPSSDMFVTPTPSTHQKIHVSYQIPDDLNKAANFQNNNFIIYTRKVGRDRAVGKATRWLLGGPGIEFRWEARFSAPLQTDPEAHPAPCTIVTGSFPGVKRPGRGVGHPPIQRPG
jgi:hypothetical protein